MLSYLQRVHQGDTEESIMYIEATSGVQFLCQGSQRHKMGTLNTKAPQNSVKKNIVYINLISSTELSKHQNAPS